MLRLEASTRLPRNEMIARIARAIQASGGSIIDSRFFSNLALFISAEISASKLAHLHEALAATELNLSAASLVSLDSCSTPGTDQPAVPFHLVVTFIHSEPDLRIAVPAVPG